jgi:hypothetical protein
MNKYWESRMQAGEDEKKILLDQKEQLQKELQAVMVSVACIHPSVPYHHVLLLVSYHSIV